jgi:predicted AlkP superfamily pyrophosphatase or phosphodiesterase
MNNMLNDTSLDTLCAALAYTIDVAAPEKAAPADERLKEYVDTVFNGEKADRIFMYNPDAIAQWVYEKYAFQLREAINRTELILPYCTVMPSVTPVCFGTMYTGAQPEVHGIQKYRKPVLTIDTLFDALIRAGKKVAIVAMENCSIAKIFLERELDYFIYTSDEEINAKAAELIMKDEHDFIVVYNGNYDSRMHKSGPESIDALGELRHNSAAFGAFSVLIERFWKNHNTLVGFAMDHGCHEIDGECGSHGLDMPEDLNIVHLYKGYPKAK